LELLDLDRRVAEVVRPLALAGAAELRCVPGADGVLVVYSRPVLLLRIRRAPIHHPAAAAGRKKREPAAALSTARGVRLRSTTRKNKKQEKAGLSHFTGPHEKKKPKMLTKEAPLGLPELAAART
jgi:hypothetical protein